MIINRLLKSWAMPPLQLSNGLHALRDRELLLGLAKDALRLHALGNVARYLGKADDLVCIIADRIDHDRSPEARAIFGALASPPPRSVLHWPLFPTPVVEAQLRDPHQCRTG